MDRNARLILLGRACAQRVRFDLCERVSALTERAGTHRLTLTVVLVWVVGAIVVVVLVENRCFMFGCDECVALRVIVGPSTEENNSWSSRPFVEKEGSSSGSEVVAVTRMAVTFIPWYLFTSISCCKISWDYRSVCCRGPCGEK